MKKLYIAFLLTALIGFLGCSQRSNEPIETTINIEIDENSKLIFEGKPVTFKEFSLIAANRINELTDKGIERSEIIVLLSAAKDVKMGLIVDLQYELRELKVRKINYSNN